MSVRTRIRLSAAILLGLTAPLALCGCAGRSAIATELPPAATALPAATPSPRPTLEAEWIRPAAFAGSWYPADPTELTSMVDAVLGAAPSVDGVPLALVVPHAGYIYSGSVAAAGFRQLQGADLDIAIIIASDHQAPISNPISVWAEGGFETPLGVVPVDTDLAQALVDADPHITFDPAAHEAEHMIEIELPFLQRACPDCKLVPVLMGNDDPETIEALADALLAALPGERAVVIASSDLSHYPSYEDALKVDGATLSAIETGDPDALRDTIAQSMSAGVPNLVTCACGAAPIQVAMRVACGLGADTISVLHYANSGDSPFGEMDQVVGYGAVMLWHYEAPILTEAHREELLQLARGAIESHLSSGSFPDYEPQDPVLARRSGAFVTLLKEGELRGCVGHLGVDLPLYEVVQEMAVAAAEDKRFAPVIADELSELTIEISVLTPMHRLSDIDQIELGIHGLVLRQGASQGVFLPQVPLEQGWDRQATLENLCLKAGLSLDCWGADAWLYTFEAIVIAEG